MVAYRQRLSVGLSTFNRRDSGLAQCPTGHAERQAAARIGQQGPAGTRPFLRKAGRQARNGYRRKLLGVAAPASQWRTLQGRGSGAGVIHAARCTWLRLDTYRRQQNPALRPWLALIPIGYAWPSASPRILPAELVACPCGDGAVYRAFATCEVTQAIKRPSGWGRFKRLVLAKLKTLIVIVRALLEFSDSDGDHIMSTHS